MTDDLRILKKKEETELQLEGGGEKKLFSSSIESDSISRLVGSQAGRLGSFPITELCAKLLENKSIGIFDRLDLL